MEVTKIVCEGMEEEEEVKWVKHYSSLHQILLVGEGDFSFSLSLAKAFGSAINIVATSHDTYDNLLKKYGKAKSNVEELKKMGAAIIHKVDATKMKLHVGLRTRKFDRIIFNFPHAGFKGKEDHPQLIKLHRQLVRGFFKNASRMLWAYGEIHVSHKTAGPFSHWNLEELAAENSLLLLECANFSIEDYPGYNNKRGDGPRSDQPFPLGKCSTFKFIIGHLLKKKNPLRNTELLPSYSSISPIMDSYLDYRSINDISYPETRVPLILERVPRSINCLEFRETAQWPFSRIDNFGLRMQGNNDFEFIDSNKFSLRMHELEYSTFPGVSLRSRVPPTFSYNPDPLEAPRRASFGYHNYLRHYEELPSRRVAVLECGGMFDRRIEWDEKARLRELIICHGI